jgi:hypothetical protein
MLDARPVGRQLSTVAAAAFGLLFLQRLRMLACLGVTDRQ